jgi:hypothetical protein
MGVSYKLLFAEEEPQAISVDMTRECIEVPLLVLCTAA